MSEFGREFVFWLLVGILVTAIIWELAVLYYMGDRDDLQQSVPSEAEEVGKAEQGKAGPANKESRR